MISTCGAGIRGIIPAYAGSTHARHRRCAAGRDHPRIRGEHGFGANETCLVLGSSPHTRGAPLLARAHDRDIGIIPAYAGSTRRPSRRRGRRADHPRIRGEHPHHVVGAEVETGSSPHTRGALDDRGEGSEGGRIIPAYAGSTAYNTSRRRSRWDHPRIRGEHL